MVEKLTPLQINAWLSQAKADGKPAALAVGGAAGLYLRVSPTGAASWVLRTTIGGKRVERGLGGYPTIPLGKAREKAAEARADARQGVDPKASRQAAADAAAALAKARASERTFQQAAEACIAAKEGGWRNAKHAAQWVSTLTQYAYPKIGDKLCSAITRADIVAILDPIWATKQETASRLRGRLQVVLDYAAARDWIPEGMANPAALTARLKDALPAVLRDAGRAGRRGHHAALPWQDVPAFMAELAQHRGSAARALEFVILTAARSGEVRGMRWGEVAGDRWTVPASRMKAGKAHNVPLSAQARAILDALRPDEVDPDALVFPSPRSGVMLSDMAFTRLVKPRGVTAHGFRSSFRDYCADHGHDRQLAEAALAHAVGNAVEAAYLRTAMVKRREGLMQAWADFAKPARLTLLQKAG